MLNSGGVAETLGGGGGGVLSLNIAWMYNKVMAWRHSYQPEIITSIPKSKINNANTVV